MQEEVPSLTILRTSIALSMTSVGTGFGFGTATTKPFGSSSALLSWISAATSCGVSRRSCALSPLSCVKNAGNWFVWYPMTGTLYIHHRERLSKSASHTRMTHYSSSLHRTCVSRYSSVRGMSRIDLMPAQITATGVRESSTRSVDTSAAQNRIQHQHTAAISYNSHPSLSIFVFTRSPIVSSTKRCTPPIPPVTNTLIPAACAIRLHAFIP